MNGAPWIFLKFFPRSGLSEPIEKSRSRRKWSSGCWKPHRVRPAGAMRSPGRSLSSGTRRPRKKIGKLYAEAWRWYKRRRIKRSSLPERAKRDGDAFAGTLDRVPVLIFACLDRRKLGIPYDLPLWPITRTTAYGSIFPAVQNLLLTARALGLGSVLTTLHGRYERKIKKILGLPPYVQTCALVPIGFPAVPFGKTRRIPTGRFVHYDQW